MKSTKPAAKAAPKVKPLPEDVLQIVREQCKAMSQSELGDLLGVSNTAISQAKHDKFKGDADKFIARVRGAFAGTTSHCPVLGVISTKVCIDQQAMPAVYTNPQRVAISRACKKCPHAQVNRPQPPQPGARDEV